MAFVTIIRTAVFAVAAAILAQSTFAQGGNTDLRPEAEADAPIATNSAPLEPVTPLVESNDIEAAPAAAQSIEHTDIIVEGERLSVRVQRTDTSSPLIDAEPIFTHLKGQVSFEGAVILVKRFQDGAMLSIDFSDGTVRANGSLLGGLPEFKQTDTASYWLSLNEISVLTGTIVSENEAGLWTFTLDERLRPQFDLDLFVQGTLLQTVENEPRTIGPVLLIPLQPVADALGHALERDGNIVTVTRLHDGAELSLDLTNGLVSVNGIPRGVTPNIAYIDPDLLLLPATAIETLTGTHVVLEPGSSRIEINLDERLGGGALPGEQINQDASKTGLVIESLDFRLSDQGPQTFTLRSHVGKYNTRLRYESVGGFTAAEELQPGFVGAEIQSLDGWVAGLGDQITQFRELQGVGQGRIRGASWRKRRPSGAVIAVAAGLAVQGSEQINDRVARPVYGGFVGGGRLVSSDGQTEYGLSFSVPDVDDEPTEFVASYRKTVNFDKDRDAAGFRRIQVQADAGVFTGGERTVADARIRADVSYDLNERAGLTASVDYTGSAFNGAGGFGDTNIDTSVENPDTPDTGAGSRILAALSADWHARKQIGPVDGLALGARVAYSRVNERSTVTVSGSANGQIAKTGIDFALDTRLSRFRDVLSGQQTQTRTRLNARKSFKWADIQATYNLTTTANGPASHSLVTTIAARSWYKRLSDNGAFVQIAPNASAVVGSGEFNFRAGATASAGTGDLFNNRFSVTGQVSALQSVAAEDSGQTFFGSAQARYRIFKGIELTAAYFDNFDDQRNVTVGLTGKIDFNPPRRYSKAQEGRGVLTGQVFFDRNRDGIRQDDEPGIGGAGVRIQGSRLALRADRNGFYTIQNLPANLYDLGLGLETLPLGYLPQQDFVARATVGENRVTRLDIPVIASGQIRGTLFADTNNNGSVDPGEERFEGLRVSLIKADDTEQKDDQYSVSFGQFSFENVEPGDYIVRTRIGGALVERRITIHEEDLFRKLPFGLNRVELGLEDMDRVEVEPIQGEA